MGGLISPLFLTLLLTRISGVPLLERKADQKWGGRAEYETYKKTTPVLIPKLAVELSGPQINHFGNESEEK